MFLPGINISESFYPPRGFQPVNRGLHCTNVLFKGKAFFCFSPLCAVGVLPGLTLIVRNDSSELKDYMSKELGGTGVRRRWLSDVTITFISFSILLHVI